MPQNCAICLVNAAKYTCPACNAKTCSAECVKRHKKQAQCSGLLDEARFIPKNELAEGPVHINRDYNFLMRMGRNISVGKNDVKSNAKNVLKRERGSNFTRNKRRQTGPTSAADTRAELVAEAFPNNPAITVKRQNTLVVLLPEGMARASGNKTGYDKKQQCFTWTIQWLFVDLTGKTLKELTSYRASEAGVLKESFPLNFLGSAEPEDINRDNLHFYLKNVIDPTRVIKLNAESTIADALKDTIVLEYPCIYVSVGEVDSFTADSLDEAYKRPENSESSSPYDSDDSSDSSSSSESSDSSDDEDEKADTEIKHETTPQLEYQPEKYISDAPVDPKKSSNLSAAEAIARFLQRSKDAQQEIAHDESDNEAPEESSSKPEL